MCCYYNVSIVLGSSLCQRSEASDGRGHTRPQAWARGALASSANVVKCFCALTVTAKRPVDELFVHYFHNLSSASGGFAPRPPLGIHPWVMLGYLCPETPNLPTPEKILRAPMHVALTCIWGNSPYVGSFHSMTHRGDQISVFSLLFTVHVMSGRCGRDNIYTTVNKPQKF